MLAPYRVLDCTDDRGNLAGFMLAQMGADVILVEPPGGSAARLRGPFAADRADDPDASLWHRAYNRGKRSVTLDLTCAEDRARFKGLAATADVVLWSGRPADLPFTYDELAAVNPAIVLGTLTPFGLTGPKADWAASDLTVAAAGCQLALTGDTDRAPLRAGVPQAFLHGSGDLAVGVLLALAERVRSGLGQAVDVSAQASFLQASFAYALNKAWDNEPLGRSGEGINVGSFKLRWGYPAADGEVSITLLFGAAFKEFTPNLFNWIYEEGGCDEATRDKPWEDLIVRLLDGREPISELDRLAEVIAGFTAARTKAELLAEAQRRRVLLAPVAGLTEVVAHEHLEARGYWDEIDAKRHPGRFVVASGAPLRRLGPPPRPGEHTEEVLTQFANETALRDVGVGESTSIRCLGDPPATPSPLPLDGLKVVDLTWSIAGPLVGRTLVDFGATVVRVETQQRVDVSRTVMPLHPLNEKHPQECGGLFANCNAGKLGIELDLRTEAGRDVLWDLLRWADVVVESFSAGAFARMGFSYEKIAAVNPSVIVVSSCLPGQTGNLNLPGYGNLSSALFGFHFTTRWPDRPAAGPFGAYTDTVSPRFTLAALLAALDHRRRTGQGQYLDLSQVEASLHLLAPALLDASINGREYESLGNGDRQMSPHGVYPCTGDDRWVAVACIDEEDWQLLAGEIGRPELAALPLVERLTRRDELDAYVAQWSSGRSAEEAERRLQELGIASHQVQNSAECLADPQLAHRRHYVNIDHPFIGPVPVEAPRVLLGRTPGRVHGPGPTYGQHAYEVLTGLLGYDDERFAAVAAAGGLG